MPRKLRSKSRPGGSFTGHLQDYRSNDKSNPDGPGSDYSVSYVDTVSDNIGSPIVPSPCTIQNQRGCVFIDGFMSTGSGLGLGLESVPYLPTAGALPFIDVLPAPSGWVLSLVARTNPSRPNLNPPEMLQNLYELPRMIRGLWDFLKHPGTIFTPRGAANNYLGVQFGWLPFIKDLTDLLDLQGLIDKRLKELNQLHSGKGLRRRVQMGGDTQTAVASIQFPGLNSIIVTAQNSREIKRKCWATIRWKPTGSLPVYHPSDVRYRSHIRNVVLGLTPEGLFKGLWAIIPWTWLIGWFTNIGSYALAQSNSVPAQWGEACFMSQMIITTKPAGFKVSGGLKIGTYRQYGEHVRTKKTRIIGSTTLTPGVNMPFLDMFKLSVLGALGVQRFHTLALFR